MYDLQKGRFVMNDVNTINDFCALDITCAVLSCLVLSQAVLFVGVSSSFG